MACDSCEKVSMLHTFHGSNQRKFSFVRIVNPKIGMFYDMFWWIENPKKTINYNWIDGLIV